MSALPNTQTLKLETVNDIVFVELNRPEKRNAMNSIMVDELNQVFAAIENRKECRAVVLSGAGGHFCAGGDISGMSQDSNDNGKSAAWQFNRAFGHLITRVNRAPQIVVTLLEGVVMGGGLGLACVSDVAIADESARFAMPETSLGIIPAQISPFVVARIGLTQARRLCLLGQVVNGAQAKELGLIHELSADLEQSLALILNQVKQCAPSATAATKQLILDMVEHSDLDEFLDRAADDFATALNSSEGQEGTKAFVQKRKPSWAQESE